MKIFSKVINDKTKQLDCIVCGDTPVLEGYSELEREIGYDGNWYVKGYAPEKPVETLQAEVRAIRNSYLEKYVDPKQKVLVWDGLSEEDRQLYANYRTYLLNYTKQEDWYLQNPMTLDEWKQSVG